MTVHRIEPKTKGKDTSNPPVSPKSEEHPFGGCNRLLTHYQTIGTELLKFEEQHERYGGGATAISSFQEGVSFVPVEVLEAFLDDLLDLDVKDETLFLVRESFGFRSIYFYIPLSGLLLSIGSGLYATSLGASIYLSFALTVSLAIPFAVLWQLSPRGASRRLILAQVLSQEIARRRGHDGGAKISTFGFSDWFARKSGQSLTSSSCDIFH